MVAKRKEERGEKTGSVKIYHAAIGTLTEYSTCVS